MLLRRFTQADAGPLAALYGDPRVMRFITVQPPSLGSAFEHLPCDRVVATTMADSAHARAASMMTSGSTLLPLSTGTSSVVTLANRDASRCVNSGERAALHTDSTP